MDKTLADTIREAIHKDGRTIYRLAKDTGVDHSILVRFIHGQRDLSLRTADVVCKALGLRLTKGRGR